MRTNKSILVILLLLNSAVTFSQQQKKIAAWEHPILKALEKKQPSLVTFSHEKDDNYFIPLAILNKTNARLYYISTFGFVFDSLPVGPVLMKELAAKKKDAFTIYTSLATSECLAELEEIKEQIRGNKFDSAKLARRQTYFNYKFLSNNSSSLEQLTFIANIEKQVWQNYQLLNLVITEKTDTAFLQKKASWSSFEPAKIKLHGDKEIKSVEFTASNRFSRLGRAVLHPANATIYLYNRKQELADSFTIKEDKLKDLTSEKQDVFALYRMWLEWQLENADKQINSLAITKQAKFNTESITEEQLMRLDTLLRYASYIEKKISYATLPDKDLLLINLLEQAKTTARKNWNNTTKQWEAVLMPPAMTGSASGGKVIRGSKEYFLTDHRGNVIATVSDRKIQVDSNNDGIVDYYVADVVTATDYAPFGSLLAGRQYRNNGQQLKYGYNGKENDNDVKGEGNQQDYGFRIYDPRLGKFLSVDPLQNSYPWFTPYQYAGNSPIGNIDLDGLENYNYNLVNAKNAEGKPVLRIESTGKEDDNLVDALIKANIRGTSERHNLYYEGKLTGSFSSFQELKIIVHGRTVAEITEIGKRIEEDDISAATIMLESARLSIKQELQNIKSTTVAQTPSRSSVITNKSRTSSGTVGAIKKQVTAANGGKLGGRSIIVDENLSPQLATDLKSAGYNVKTFAKGTTDDDIIKYASENNSIVLTNNIKDFKGKGITTFKVTENMKKKTEVGNVIKYIENVNKKAGSNPNLVQKGNNVSLAEHQ